MIYRPKDISVLEYFVIESQYQGRCFAKYRSITTDLIRLSCTHHLLSLPVAQWTPAIKEYLHTTLRPRQNGRHFADDIFKCIFLNENVWIPIEISLKFVPHGSINNIPGLVQIMAWRRPGDKPLSEPMIVSLLTHICVTRPQWVKRDPRVKCINPRSVSVHLGSSLN